MSRSAEREPPTGAEFAVDYEELWVAFDEQSGGTMEPVITEYRRQLATSGYVVVRRDALHRLNTFLEVFNDRPFHLAKIETIDDYVDGFATIEQAWDAVRQEDWDHLAAMLAADLVPAQEDQR